MSNEWFEIAWINYRKAILHGQAVTDGREVEIEQVLTDEEADKVRDLNEKHQREMNRLLKSLAKVSA